MIGCSACSSSEALRPSRNWAVESARLSAVGVLRACEKALQDYVPFYYVRPVQGIVLLGIIWVVVDGYMTRDVQ